VQRYFAFLENVFVTVLDILAYSFMLIDGFRTCLNVSLTLNTSYI